MFSDMALFNGKVVDLTWSHDIVKKSKMNKEETLKNIIIGEFPKDWEYFGVVIPINLIGKKWFKDICYELLIDDWQNNFPLLKEKWIPQKL